MALKCEKAKDRLLLIVRFPGRVFIPLQNCEINIPKAFLQDIGMVGTYPVTAVLSTRV